MRFGIFSIVTILFIMFLLVILQGTPSSEDIDSIFDTLDVNTFSKLDQNLTMDANLSKFVKYSVKGFGNELHGTYYLASWARTWLPDWLVANSELVVILAILLILSPVIGAFLQPLILVLLAAFLWLYDKIKEKRIRKRG